eukprot:2045580-Pyramimonas_sp.AAC.1
MSRGRPSTVTPPRSLHARAPSAGAPVLLYEDKLQQSHLPEEQLWDGYGNDLSVDAKNGDV